MIAFVVIQAILILISVLISQRMVENRSWLAKRMLIGGDSQEDIKKMIELAVRTFNGDPVQTDLPQYTLSVTKEAGKIVKVEVETQSTHVIYDGNHKTDERVINKAWSERGAVAMNAFVIWGVIFWLGIIIGLFVEMQMSLSALEQLAK